MSRENVELIRRHGFPRFKTTGELEWDAAHEAIEVHDHDILDAGEYRGHVGVARWFEDWGTAWAEWSFVPEEFIDAGARVVVVIHLAAKGRGSGVEVERQDALVYEVRDGLIVRVDYFNSRRQALEALEAAELAEPDWRGGSA